MLKEAATEPSGSARLGAAPPSSSYFGPRSSSISAGGSGSSAAVSAVADGGGSEQGLTVPLRPPNRRTNPLAAHPNPNTNSKEMEVVPTDALQDMARSVQRAVVVKGGRDVQLVFKHWSGIPLGLFSIELIIDLAFGFLYEF